VNERTKRGSWEPPRGKCPESVFDWGVSSYELLVGQWVRNVAVFGAVLSRCRRGSGLWSASRYVWHTVDVIRFGTERLWTVSVDPFFGVPDWDENLVAEVRAYDSLSPIVGLVALIAAAEAWRTAALEAPPMTFRHHTAKRAPSARSTSCSATRMRFATTCGTFNARFRPNLAIEPNHARVCDDGSDGSCGPDGSGRRSHLV
jgi:hypothetical protein